MTIGPEGCSLGGGIPHRRPGLLCLRRSTQDPGDRHGDRGERGMGRAFSRIDQDDNGIISPEELAQAQAMMDQMGQRRARN